MAQDDVASRLKGLKRDQLMAAKASLAAKPAVTAGIARPAAGRGRSLAGIAIGAAIGGLTMMGKGSEAQAAGPALPGGVGDRATRGREPTTPIGKPENESVPQLTDNAKRNVGIGLTTFGGLGVAAGVSLARDTKGLGKTGRIVSRTAGVAGGVAGTLVAAVGAAIALGAHKRMQQAAEQGPGKDRTDPYTDKLGRRYDKGRKITRQQE